MLDQHTKEVFRLILSDTLSAKENMAIDKTLFEFFDSNSTPILRLYTWNKSFTFGMSQSIDTIKDKQVLKSFGNNYAKRITGGGILFHGNDISYSLLIPITFVKSLNVKQSYEFICKFLLNFYNKIGLKALYAKDLENHTQTKSEYCQVGFEDYDILINKMKIGGNAQRRTKDIIFQHGSIPIKKLNSNKQSGFSLEDLNINLSQEYIQNTLIQSFKETFDVILKDSILNNKEQNNVNIILQKGL